jgi:hypothetical protein
MGSSDSRGGGGWFDDELSIYRIAEDDRFVGVHEILAASDEDAMLQARQLYCAGLVEMQRKRG